MQAPNRHRPIVDAVSESFETTGGAKVGLMNASWPLAKLTASSGSLRMAVRFLGSYVFTPDSVVSIERYTMIPVLGWGIQIRHNVAEYPSRIIFWCLGSPDALLSRIQGTGFQPQAPASSVPPPEGMPVRWQALVAVLIIWNVLFLLDGPFGKPLPGPFSVLAVALLCAANVACFYSVSFRRLILKPGRDLNEIRPVLKLIILVSGVMTAAFTALNVLIFLK